MKLAMVSGMGTVWGQYSPSILDTPSDKTVGGGEAAMLTMSFGLQDRGHEVTVYYPGAPTTYRGVRFLPVATAQLGVAVGDFDAVISWSDPWILSLVPKGTLRIFSQQLNDLPYSEKFWKNLDALFNPADIHREHLLKYIPLEWSKPIKFKTIPNGVNPALFTNPTPFEKRGHTVGYWSSPDRGLHHLLRIWPAVRARVPDAELHVFYHLKKFIESGKTVFHVPDFCWRARTLGGLMANPIEGLTIHGPVNRWELAKWQQRMKVMAYPLDPLTFTEGFSIACLEAYTAGCRVIAHPDDAIEEIHGDAVEWVRGPILDSSYLPRFTDALVEAILSTENPLAAQGAAKSKHYHWDNAVAKLDGFISELRPA